MSRTLLELELTELERLVRLEKPAGVIRLKPGTSAYRQLEIVRSLHKQYRSPMPPRVSRLWRDRANPQPKLLGESPEVEV